MSNFLGHFSRGHVVLLDRGMGMHLGHQGCADTKERAQMPARLAFRTILGSSENSVAFETVLPLKQ
jgi:hypothetical protein